MGLLPEFFMLLGIDIFLAMSLLSVFLEDDLPSSLKRRFPVAAIFGLAVTLRKRQPVFFGGESKREKFH